jgi:hypothetical protein
MLYFYTSEEHVVKGELMIEANTTIDNHSRRLPSKKLLQRKKQKKRCLRFYCP